MQKMQKVAPEIRQIQDRYKKYSMSDPRKKKMNEEVMAVYSREGINPMGSCLPMVFQMPIWWALWRVLTRRDRIAARAVYGLDPRPFGKGSVLYFAHWHDHHDVSNDENDAADDGGPGAAKNDDVDAADDGIYSSSGFRAD